MAAVEAEVVARTPVAVSPAVRLLRLGLIQGRIEILQFLRNRAQVIFTLAFPTVLLIVLGSIFDGRLPAGVTVAQYFVTGMIASGLVATGFQALAIQIPIERDRGVLKRLRGTPMPPSVYFFGKVIMVVFVAIVETAVLLGLGIAFLGLSAPATASRWLTLLWVGLLGIAACTLCGIAFSSLAKTSRSGPAVVTPVAVVLQFISGVFFVYTDLPAWMRHIAALFPLKWICQGMRSVFLPDAFAAHESAGSWELGRVALVLGAWCIGGVILCLATFRWTTRQ